MKVDVIISTYNRPDTLQRVLQGLDTQTLIANEVVIADDGSGPATAALIRKMQKEVCFPLTHVWQADQGFQLAKIRNKAIYQSTADYIIILDEDCIPNRFFINDHVQLAKSGFLFQGKRVLVGPKMSKDFTQKTANSFRRLIFAGLQNKISNAHHIFRISWLPAITSQRISGTRGCNMGFFRKDLLAVNGFNENFIGWGREDQEIVARLYKYGLKRKSHPFMAVCFHLWHPENLRQAINKNDEILQQALASDAFFTPNGIIKQRS